MRILHVVLAFNPATLYGGPTTVAYQHIKELDKRGNHVTVLTSDIFGLAPFKRYLGLEKNNIKIIRLKSYPLKNHFSFIFTPGIFRWFLKNKNNYDIVHIHFGREIFSVLAANLALSLGMKVIIQPHGMLDKTNGKRGFVDKLIVKSLLEKAKGVLALQEYEKKVLQKIAPKSQIYQLPNGMPSNNIKFFWDIAKLDKRKILFLARLHPRKRVTTFIEMAKILTKQGIDLTYRIVGPDGGDLNAAKKLVDSYSLGERVEFVGEISGENIYKEFTDSSIYVLPSVDEPFGMTVLEALSVGTPAIVTDTCQIAEFLKSKNAVIVSRPEAIDLANSITRILNNKRLAQSLSVNGKRVIKEYYMLENVIDRLQNIYKGEKYEYANN